MWKDKAKALSLDIPEKELARIAAVLDPLYDRLNRSFDRDLSTVEPVSVFRLDGK